MPGITPLGLNIDRCINAEKFELSSYRFKHKIMNVEVDEEADIFNSRKLTRYWRYHFFQEN